MRSSRLRSAVSGFSAVALAAAITDIACGTEDIPVATLPGPEAGHAPCSVDAGTLQSNGDGGLGGCQTGEYCEPTSCGVGTGTCEVRPTSCDGPYAPICGCDGMNYFNDCLRQSVGAASASATCSTATVAPAVCGGTKACPENDAGPTVCALVVPGAFVFTDPALTASASTFLCALPANLPEAFGTCLVLPQTPPSEAGTNELRRVGPPPSCGFGRCMNPYESLQMSLQMPGVFVEDGNCTP